ncbi:MAG: thiamine pyrophosphate-dependent enzyme [Thermodesulfobacteriota bacterium]
MTTMDDYGNNVEIQWCPGCPNFGILQAFKKALVELNKPPHEVCMVSGIGQAAKLPHYLRCNFFNGLHGRTLPVALGVHVANPKLTTIVVTGDGDCYGEGGNHFLHALRRNPDITVVVHNNEIYALTKGQASPTTPRGETRTLQIKGVELSPLYPLAVAILHGCGFVARGFAGDVEHLKDLLVAAVSYRGFSYVDVIQPCITWGTHPVSWYRERVYKIGEDYDPGNREAAMEKSMEWGEKMPIGVIYKTSPGEVFSDRFKEAVTDRPLAELQPPDAEKMSEILSEFRAAG